MMITCLLQSPFSMQQNRFSFGQCLLTSLQFAFMFCGATHKCTTLGLCTNRVYRQRPLCVQESYYSVILLSCWEPHCWPQPQPLFLQPQPGRDGGQVSTNLKACPGKSFFCMPLCRDLPSHANTLVWENVLSLLSVRPWGNQLQKLQYNQFQGQLQNTNATNRIGGLGLVFFDFFRRCLAFLMLSFFHTIPSALFASVVQLCIFTAACAEECKFYLFFKNLRNGSCLSSILFSLHSKLCFSCMKQARGAEPHTISGLCHFSYMEQQLYFDVISFGFLIIRIICC